MSANSLQLKRILKQPIEKDKITAGATARGVYDHDQYIRLLFEVNQKSKTDYYTDESHDGIHFQNKDECIFFQQEDTNPFSENLSSFRISKTGSTFVLTATSGTGSKRLLSIFTSSDLTNFRHRASLSGFSAPAVVILQPFNKGKYILFSGGDSVRTASSSDLISWQIHKTILTRPQRGTSLEIGTVIPTRDGMLALYAERSTLSDGAPSFALHAILVDTHDCERIIWKSDISIFEQLASYDGKPIHLLGMLVSANKLISYWAIQGGGIFAVLHGNINSVYEKGSRFPFMHLTRHEENPVIKPIAHHYWESKATFNPAALYEEGKVHLVYRAIGDQDMSMLGYASSRDGVHIDERLADPVYVPNEPFEFTGHPVPASAIPSASPYASGGGGYGGCEDPRLTKIGNKVYMTYVAYDGSNPPRVALTSISSSDFFAKKWNWEKPVLVSPPNVVDKNAVLFPEKIDGKYVIMHRIFPHILIDFVDDLDFDGRTFLSGQHKIAPRASSWDSRKIGAGAPPLRTKYGWLLIYHAVGDTDSARYKIGAMLLDLNDPTAVIARSRYPILSPEMHYENEGMKYGIAYPCGAVIIDDTLFVYYGGADMVTCVATVPLTPFLDELVDTGTHHFAHIQIEE